VGAATRWCCCKVVVVARWVLLQGI